MSEKWVACIIRDPFWVPAFDLDALVEPMVCLRLRHGVFDGVQGSSRVLPTMFPANCFFLDFNFLFVLIGYAAYLISH